MVIVRSIIGFFSLLIFTRFLGKQHVSQLTFFDYVLGITIGSTASSLTTDLYTSAWHHWVGLLSWAALVYILQWITLKFRYASKFIDSEPTIIIMNGKIMEDALRKMRYRVTDILEQLREKDIFDLTEVDFAILETNGSLSVIKKPEYQNITLKDLNIPPKTTGLSIEVIFNGTVVEQNLQQINHSKKWLEYELKKQNVGSISEVFLATIAPSGTLYIDTYKDHLKKLIDIGDYKGPF